MAGKAWCASYRAASGVLATHFPHLWAPPPFWPKAGILNRHGGAEREQGKEKQQQALQMAHSMEAGRSFRTLPHPLTELPPGQHRGSFTHKVLS